MPMPETPVHEYDLAMPGEQDVGLARETGNMKAIAIAKGMNKAANRHLRLAASIANPAHALAALLRSQGIGHPLPSNRLRRHRSLRTIYTIRKIIEIPFWAWPRVRVFSQSNQQVFPCVARWADPAQECLCPLLFSALDVTHSPCNYLTF